jgi:hypothetical protein
MKYIKKDAIIPIEIGTHFIQRIQGAVLYFSTLLTEEELKQLDIDVKNGITQWSDPKISHLYTLYCLLNAIETSAETNNLTEQDQHPGQ